MSEPKMQIKVKSYDHTEFETEVSVGEGKQLMEQLKKGYNLQIFRNELQEVFFREHNRMMHMEDGTYPVNLVSRLLDRLDYDYGTEFQKTESIFKAERKELERIVASKNEQLDLLRGEDA
ncbi:hypothetical protein BKP56_09140 [Marinilactibacillus sp. 15R]|uniref:hypothetical protein n=1 Tax=Marinilactibacillus sp. 15R TaxID=1911586 RepID=UPI0009098D93|nr:hypothetical protein [Marinilactibacillus sp. 15R]API89408.1 hypothetical protein BKP56_09140 [Marinilactibacillus sp. 15R]